MTLPSQKFIASTEECFRHFLTMNPQLDATELLAEFCLPKAKGAVTSVQAWQRGSVAFPRGEALLRLRCFLTLAGYEVEEFSQLEGIVRQLAMMISMNRTTPEVAGGKLGYDPGNSVHSVWRITQGKTSFTPSVRRALKAFVGRSRRQVNKDAERWRERILQVTGSPPSPKIEKPEPDLQGALMSEVATSFGRMVTALTPMAQALRRSERPQAVSDATRGGASIDELIKVLQELRESL